MNLRGHHSTQYRGWEGSRLYRGPSHRPGPPPSPTPGSGDVRAWAQPLGYSGFMGCCHLEWEEGHSCLSPAFPPLRLLSGFGLSMDAGKTPRFRRKASPSPHINRDSCFLYSFYTKSPTECNQENKNTTSPAGKDGCHQHGHELSCCLLVCVGG